MPTVPLNSHSWVLTAIWITGTPALPRTSSACSSTPSELPTPGKHSWAQPVTARSYVNQVLPKRSRATRYRGLPFRAV
jgi:hypothetical protein